MVDRSRTKIVMPTHAAIILAIEGHSSSQAGQSLYRAIGKAAQTEDCGQSKNGKWNIDEGRELTSMETVDPKRLVKLGQGCRSPVSHGSCQSREKSHL